MGIEAHITELRDKHKTLDLKIQKERSHPNIDSIKITELKRQKLHIKEQITKLSEQTN